MFIVARCLIPCHLSRKWSILLVSLKFQTYIAQCHNFHLYFPLSRIFTTFPVAPYIRHWGWSNNRQTIAFKRTDKIHTFFFEKINRVCASIILYPMYVYNSRSRHRVRIFPSPFPKNKFSLYYSKWWIRGGEDNVSE